MSFPEYGDLIHVDFTPSEDSEPGEFEDPHPAIVVQYTNSDDRAVVVAQFHRVTSKASLVKSGCPEQLTG